VGSEYCSAKSFHRKSHGVILSFTLANLFSENYPLHVIEPIHGPSIPATMQIEQVITSTGDEHELPLLDV